jgi:UPF0755 protein
MTVKNFFYSFVATICFFAIIITCYFWINLYGKSTTKDGHVIIPKHCSIRDISEILEKEAGIQSKSFFVIYASILSHYGKNIMAGEYTFPKYSTVSHIFNKITDGEVLVHKVTVPEGLTNHQIIDLLKTQYGLINNVNEECNYKEGYLYPNTYKYFYGTQISFLLNNMNEKMQKLLLLEWENRDVSSTQELKNQEQALVLASIIEKEAKFEDERAMIAAVYLNRIKINMPLQADPTVIYGISKLHSFNRKLTYEDLKSDSPYNTYKHIGLPPTPICNPGKSSIFAALHPAKIDALYFVGDNSGRHIFTKHYKQHLKNISSIKAQN